MQIDLFMSGLIALVLSDAPTGKKCNHAASGEVRVLMLRGMDDMQHRPKLTIDLDHVPRALVNEESDEPDQIVTLPDASGVPRRVGTWNLDEHSVEFSAPVTIKLADGKRKAGSGNKKWKNGYPNESMSDPNETYSDFSWIADLQEACPGAGPVRKGCVENPPKACNQVIARTSLSYNQAAGTPELTPAWRAAKDKRVFKTHPDYAQVMADGAGATGLSLPGDYSLLTLKPFRPCTEDDPPSCKNDPLRAPRTIILQKAPDAKSVSLWLSNEPEVLMDPKPLDIPHFRSYYGILKDQAVASACKTPSAGTVGSLVKCSICSSCNGE